MSRIINIRGTSGAGKSQIVYDLMEKCGATEQILDNSPPGKRKIFGYELFKSQVGVVGRYETACGGCDTIKTQDEIRERVRWFAARFPNVIFEGLLVSQIYGPWAEFAQERVRFDDSFVWAQLDTPLEECIRRVIHRRANAGNFAVLDPDNSLTPKWHSCQRNFVKAQADHLNPQWIRHLSATEDVLALLDLK